MPTGSDATYQPSIYRERGGNRLVVDSGGELDVLSGGVMDIESGGSVDFADGGRFTLPVTTRGSSQVATNISNFGITTITATTTGPTYTIDAPVAGVMKVIACTANTSSGTASVVTNTTDVAFSSSGANQLNWNSIQDRVLLVGQTATQWLIASSLGSTNAGVALATQST